MSQAPRHQVHLVELSLIAEHHYSATLGYLHAAIRADPVLDAALEVHKHIAHVQLGTSGETLDALVEQMQEPAVLALTVYFWNRDDSVELARRVKLRWPETVVVMGGNDVSQQQEQLFGQAPWVDVLVHGEGELRFAELCRRLLLEGGSAADVRGVSFWSGTGTDRVLATTEAADRIADLDDIPSPLIGDVYSDAELGSTRLLIYETNRGCPYSCSFCYWGGATNSKVRQFPMDRVRAELDRIVRVAMPGSSIFVCDANFGILARDLEIAELFVALCKKYDKHLTFMTNWAKNSNSKVVDIATVLHEHGLSGAITLSAQSFDARTLQIARRSNIKIDRYRSLQEEFRSRGIPTYTDLIWGLPGESYATHLDGVERVIQSGGCPVVYPLLLLNNTEYASDTFGAEHPLQTRRLPCDVSNPSLVADVVVAHEEMTPEQWVRGMQHVSATGLFAKASMRASMRYVSAATGVRIVDMVDVLIDHLDAGLEAAPAVTRVQQNHRDCMLTPTGIDEALLREVLDDATMPEDRHYQAMMHLVMDDPRRHRAVIEECTGVLVDHFGLRGAPGLELLPGAQTIDAAAGSVWRSGVRRSRLSASWAASPRVLDALVAGGDAPGWAYDPEADVVLGRLLAKPERAAFSLSVYSLALLKGARRLLWDADTTLVQGALPVVVPMAG